MAFKDIEEDSYDLADRIIADLEEISNSIENAKLLNYTGVLSGTIDGNKFKFEKNTHLSY